MLIDHDQYFYKLIMLFIESNASGNLTTGVTAMLITAPGGEFLGIRVEWSIKPEYLCCQFTTLRVELNDNEHGKDISGSERVKDFSSDLLDCNRQYTPRVIAVVSGISKSDYGAPLFYRSKIKSQQLLYIL